MLAVWCSSAVWSLLPDSPRTKSYQSSRRGNNANSSSSESLRSPLMPMRQENSFKEFIWQHVEMAFNKGFDDNVGRNPVAARFEVRPLISVFSPPVPCRGEGVWCAHLLDIFPLHSLIPIYVPQAFTTGTHLNHLWLWGGRPILFCEPTREAVLAMTQLKSKEKIWNKWRWMDQEGSNQDKGEIAGSTESIFWPTTCIYFLHLLCSNEMWVTLSPGGLGVKF